MLNLSSSEKWSLRELPSVKFDIGRRRWSWTCDRSNVILYNGVQCKVKAFRSVVHLSYCLYLIRPADSVNSGSRATSSTSTAFVKTTNTTEAILLLLVISALDFHNMILPFLLLKTFGHKLSYDMIRHQCCDAQATRTLFAFADLFGSCEVAVGGRRDVLQAFLMITD